MWDLRQAHKSKTWDGFLEKNFKKVIGIFLKTKKKFSCYW